MYIYLWPWDHLALGNLQPKLSISSSGGIRHGAEDISLMLIWLHCYRLSFAVSLSFQPARFLSDAGIWFGESRKEWSILIQPLLLSHNSSPFPLCGYHLNSLHFLLSFFLSMYSFFFSLQCAIIITPLLDAQAINQGLSFSCTHLPWQKQNQ